MLDGKESLQSGGVAYECQGNETRLVDCMITLDTAEIPCFYALVKCVSAGAVNATSSLGLTSSQPPTSVPEDGGVPTAVFAGVGGVVVVIIALILLVTLLIVILGRKKRNYRHKLSRWP